MLSLNRSKNIKLLIGFLVFYDSKPITLELRSRRGGGFLGSSLPNHDAKGLKKKKITIYMMHEMIAQMMHALMH